MFFARLTGKHSEHQDVIIQRHRFTNSYRASDRVSQYLIRHVLYDAKWSPIDLVFRLLVWFQYSRNLGSSPAKHGEHLLGGL